MSDTHSRDLAYQKDLSWLDIAADRLDFFPMTPGSSHEIAKTSFLRAARWFKPVCTFLRPIRHDNTMFRMDSSFLALTFSEINLVAEAIRTSSSLASNSTRLSIKTQYHSSLTIEGKAPAAIFFPAALCLPRLRHVELIDMLLESSRFVQFLSRHGLDFLDIIWVLKLNLV